MSNLNLKITNCAKIKFQNRMVLNFTRRKTMILFCLCFMLFVVSNAGAQTRIYAASITGQSNVDNAPNAIDENIATRARVRANAGLVGGVGAYSGYIELEFDETLPANTTSYVRIGTEDDLLTSLLGGSLGNLLADVAGVLLIGNQSFTVEARNVNTTVLSGNSQIASDFGGNRLRVITNSAGEFFLMVTPNAAYNRIRLTNNVGALVGLGNTKRLDVYEAFHIETGTSANCGTAAYTSFSGSGITLDLLQLGQAGVANPQNAIDASATNFSTLSLGILGVGSSVQQTVYFEGLSQPTDQFNVRIRLAQTLLDANVVNSIRIVASNGGTIVSDQALNTLLTINLLTLQGGQPANIPITPGAPVDRITVVFYSLVGASVAQNLDFYGAVRNPAPPTVTDPATTNAQVCSGGTASLLANAGAGNELRWYDAATGGNLLATVANGDTYTTPALTATTIFYVASRKVGCPEESTRVAVTVTVNTIATPTTTNITQELCAFASPTIEDLQVNESNVVFYTAASGGTPIAAGTALTDGTTYYAAIQDTGTGCESTVRLAITVDLVPLCAVTLNLKVMLQGALFNAAGGLMRDDLRQQGLVPLSQPYSSALSARFTHVGGGTEVTTQAVLDANAGTADAIVDWVFVEVRDAANAQTVIRTVSALLQRDGDIIAANGGPLQVEGLPGTFYISIKHRNHFGAMSSQLLTAVNDAVTLDFTTIANANLYTLPGFSGNEAMATVGSVRALYSGNANFDSQVKYDGAGNDRQVAAAQVLTFPGNTSQLLNYSNAVTYASGDINLDGKVAYDGANNDRQVMLNIVVTYPLNTGGLGNYNGLSEQIPQ
jgi:hypothetical protein